MPMPEATVNKDDSSALREDDIRGARETVVVDAIAKA